MMYGFSLINILQKYSKILVLKLLQYVISHTCTFPLCKTQHELSKQNYFPHESLPCRQGDINQRVAVHCPRQPG